MKDIEDLMPKVAQFAPGLPEPTAIEHIRDAAIILCKRTRCWRELLESQTTGALNALPTMPVGADLFEIESAYFDDQELERVGFSHDMLFHDVGIPHSISQASPNTVLLEPGGVGTLKLSAYLKPSQNTDQLPDFMFDQFHDALVSGALSTILLLPNQPFSSPQLAMAFGGQFNSILDRNFAFNVRGQQRAPVRTKASFM